MAALILNSAGLPEPSPEILRRLRQVHPGFGLKFLPGASTQHWVVTLDWPRGDSRWQMVQQQEMSAADAWDVVRYVPIDCPLEQVPSLIENALRKHPREEVRNVANDIHKFNANVAQKAAEQAIGEVLDMPDPSSQGRKVTGRRVRHVVPKE